MTPLVISLTIITLATLALCIQFARELRGVRPQARVSVKLNRLLHYRDKAKALDRYMCADITLGELVTLYDRIQKEKEKHDKKIKKEIQSKVSPRARG